MTIAVEAVNAWRKVTSGEAPPDTDAELNAMVIETPDGVKAEQLATP
jgi:hypothetical protein